MERKKHYAAHFVRRKVDPYGPTNRFFYGFLEFNNSEVISSSMHLLVRI